MSLPLIHAGRTNPGLSAALDLRFALDKSLTAYRGPTPSFSRASTGSYFDGSGVLRYAALNLLTYSEDFTNPVWAASNSSILSNVATSPTGTLTADKLIENTAGPTTHVVTYNTGVIGTLFSVYAKAGERGWMALQQNAFARYCYFDLVNGVVGFASGATGFISSAGSGWYRCSILVPSGGGFWNIFISPSDNGATYTGNGTSGLFVWGAQLEASSTVGTYVPTTTAANSAPRFNHTFNGTSWVSRGLLVEEQRVNTALHSENFTNAVWAKTRMTVAANYAAAPDGTGTATLVYPSTGAYSNLQQSLGVSINPPATFYTASIYAKASGKSWLYVYGVNGAYSAFFNLSTGVIGHAPTLTGYAAKITPVGNGWYRCQWTTSTVNNSYYSAFGVADVGNVENQNVVGNGTDGVLVWGAQMELGAFPTSYIPTTSASVTRSADVCQITGTDFSGMWNASEGSVVADFDLFASSGNASPWTALSNTTNIIQLYRAGATDLRGFVYTSGVVQADFSIGTYSNPSKSSVAYKANDFSGSANGAAVGTDTTGTIPSTDKLYLMASENNIITSGHIARLRYFNKRLSNTNLQKLSDPDPTLNLQFALNKTLTPVAGPAPSFSRASTGTYFNASGVLTSAAINTPRFDHVLSGGQWVSRGLLIEEQRTNICLQSNTFNTTWLTLDGTVTANAALSPDGTNNAWKLNETSANSPSHGIYQPLTIGSGTYTWSVFAKAGERNWLQFLAYSSSTNYFTWFNLANGTVGTNAAGTTASIQDIGNGWYRCSVSRSISAGSSYAQIFAANADNNGPYAGDTTKGIYIYGCQVESGAFSTSYIPTTTAAVTRSPDVCQITGTNFSGFYNGSEGSFVTEADSIGFATTGPDRYIIAFNSSGSANIAHAIFLPTTGLSFDVYNSTLQSRLSYTQPNAGDSFKLASGYKANDFAATLNGSAVQTDTSGTVPTSTNVGIGHYPGFGQYANCHIAKLIYYPARLTNTKLQQLST